MFLKSTSKNIDDDLAEIDPSKYYINFGSILSGEEVIGEMNDFEKRAMIWMHLMAEKSKESLGHPETHSIDIDLETSRQLADEAESELAMIRFLQYRVSKSLVERFGLEKKFFMLKGNFQVVLSNKKNQEAETKRLEEVFRVEIMSTLDKTTSHDN